MIDIWMLFTMTIPFLEVVLHTIHEVFKNKRTSKIVPETRVDVLEVKSGEEERKEEEAKTNNEDEVVQGDGQPHAAHLLPCLHDHLLGCWSHPSLLLWRCARF